jgi:hypothetical protein
MKNHNMFAVKITKHCNNCEYKIGPVLALSIPEITTGRFGGGVMKDYVLQNLARQREKEILKELKGIRLLKARYAGGRKKRKEIWACLRSIMVSWKRGICPKAYRTREMMDPLHLKDQTMQHHPEW